MKHPSFKQLQDYFEAETNSERIQEHLEECNRCSEIVGQMAKVDIIFSKSSKVEVSETIKKKIFHDASSLLRQRRELIQKNVNKKISRAELRTSILKKIKELRDDALSELHLPIFQSAALTVLLIIITKVATTSTEIEYYEIIENDMTVVYSELEENIDENI